MRALPLAFNKFPSKLGKGSVVIIHGLFGSKQNWRSLGKAIASRHDHWDVFTVDLRNHGESPHSKEQSYDLMAHDVSEFMREHRIESPVVIGHSMGGKVAMHMALNGGSIGKLCVVDVSPVTKQGESVFLRYIEAMKEVERAKVKSAAQASDVLESHGVKSLAVRQFLLTNLKKSASDGQFKFRINLETIERFLPELWSFPAENMKRKYLKETLFIVGKQGDYVTEDMHPTIRTIFPQVQFDELDAGHW